MTQNILIHVSHTDTSTSQSRDHVIMSELEIAISHGTHVHVTLLSTPHRSFSTILTTKNPPDSPRKTCSRIFYYYTPLLSAFERFFFFFFFLSDFDSYSSRRVLVRRCFLVKIKKIRNACLQSFCVIIVACMNTNKLLFHGGRWASHFIYILRLVFEYT